MPITDIVIVSIIVSAFAIFAVALAWGLSDPGNRSNQSCSCGCRR